MENWGKNSICSYKNEDFNEDEVWSTTQDSSPNMKKNNFFSSSSSSSSSSSRRLHFSPRKLPSSSSSESTKEKTQLRSTSSAPVNIPDWSKIYGGNKIGSWEDEEHDGYHKAQTFNHDHDHDHDDDGHDDDDEEWVPPHELIAKKLAGTQISSSVYEGKGRTLKGRDLSKMRNAILTKTGFLE